MYIEFHFMLPTDLYLLFCRMSAFTFTAEQCSHVLSIIIDAMSKWKTSVPHWRRIPKGLDSQGTMLNFPLTCSKVHGFANIADFTFAGQLRGEGSGSNAMCSILLEDMHSIQQSKGEIPAKLRLQMDNCAKDNKNHTVLGMVALLVQEGVVEDAEVT